MTFLALFAAILGATWLLFMVGQIARGARWGLSGSLQAIVAAALLAAGLVALGVVR